MKGAEMEEKAGTGEGKRERGGDRKRKSRTFPSLFPSQPRSKDQQDILVLRAGLGGEAQPSITTAVLSPGLSCAG